MTATAKKAGLAACVASALALLAYARVAPPELPPGMACPLQQSSPPWLAKIQLQHPEATARVFSLVSCNTNDRQVFTSTTY